ncbi:hypothetical protein QBC43DRAFT_293375 [Cladorrhinum sp. PSN259]|nr:hypothetical protein QBC43DRAFT_293375 [Cladorrhinum sp. PSN259]
MDILPDSDDFYYALRSQPSSLLGGDQVDSAEFFLDPLITAAAAAAAGTPDSSVTSASASAGSAGSAGSAASSSSLTASEPTAGTPLPPADSNKIRRKPVPRRGHTKSRRGCFNCKKRKVKCQETRPECEGCLRIGLVCEYPETEKSRALILSSASSSSSSSIPSSATPSLWELELAKPPSAAMDSTPTTFTPDDMRFFHHFLTTAFPPLPLGGDKIWMDVAAVSHQYDYLMHAMLGLGASHLNLHGGKCSEKGIAHRVKAIQLLNQNLYKPCSSTAEGDARFAALFALAFQASCMPEGMTEFISMTRGCYVIANTFILPSNDSIFGSFTAEGFADSVRRLIPGPISLEGDQEAVIDEFLVSLRALAPLCKSSLEVRFLASIEFTVRRAKVWAVDAFADCASLYSLMFHATNEEFMPFTDPNNYSTQLLAIHFLLIEFALGHFTLGPKGSRFGYRKKTIVPWMERVEAALPEEYKKYAAWPMDHVRRLAAT